MNNQFIHQYLGQYEILASIGEGGMGVVYRARDTQLSREVAVKVLPPDLARDGEFVARFRREAETAASLDHPNIVAIYNIGEQNGVHYLAMRLLHGQTLNHLLQHGGALPPVRTLKLIEQLASALDYAHARGIIHRDIKPANIMVGPDDYVTLMDFGIAKAMMGSKITRTGTMIGTPENMAPEQFTGEAVDIRADVYALSVVLYEMLTGRVPFTGETPVAVSHGHVYQQPAPLRQHNPQIPPAVEQVVLRGLAKQPEARYPGAGVLTQALRAALHGGTQPGIEPLHQPLKLVLPDGREYMLAPGVLHLGRSEGNDIVLLDTQISRQHAEIHSDTQSSTLMDLGSANGTFVNDQRLAPKRPQTLQVEMSVRLGANTTLRVQSGPPAGGRTMPFEPPGVKEPHPLTKPTVHPEAPVAPQPRRPARKAGLPGWMWGVAGLGVVLVIIGLVLTASGAFQGHVTPTAAPTALAINANTPAVPTPTVYATVTPRVKKTVNVVPTSTSTPPIMTSSQQEVLGRSVQGRNILVTSVGYERYYDVVVIGSIQGDQGTTRDLVVALIEYYQDQLGKIPSDVKFHFISSLNPDGNANGSRYNANDVDLNRNWDTSDWTSAPPIPGYPNGKAGAGGTQPFSEPETRALRDLLVSLKSRSAEVRVVILHSSVNRTKGEVYPSSDDAMGITQTYADASGYDIEYAWAEYDTPGEAIKWCAEQGILAIDVVIPASQSPDTVVAGKPLLMLTVQSLNALASYEWAYVQ